MELGKHSKKMAGRNNMNGDKIKQAEWKGMVTSDLHYIKEEIKGLRNDFKYHKASVEKRIDVIENEVSKFKGMWAIISILLGVIGGILSRIVRGIFGGGA